MKNRSSPRGSAFRWLALLVVVAAGAIAVAIWYRPPEPIETSLPPDISLEHVSSRIAMAIEAARDKVIAEPANPTVWGELGMTLYAHRFSTEAVECLETAARLAPEHFEWPYLTGMILAEDDASAGIDAIRHAAELAPANDAIQCRAGELLFDLGEVEDSQRFVTRVIARSPDDPRAQLGMARLAYAKSDLSSAAEWAQKAARGVPQHPEPFQLLARIHERAGQPAAAREALDRLAQLPTTVYRWPDPVLARVEELRTDRTRLNDAVQTLIAQQRVADAIDLINRMAADEPDNPGHPQLLAQTLLRSGNPEMAGRELDAALIRMPQAGDLLYLRGVIHAGFGEFDQAEAKLRRVIEQKPDYVEALFLLANTYREMKRPDDSIRVFRETLALEPMYAPAHINLAQVLLAAGERETAIEHLRTAQRLAPDSPKLKQLLQQVGDGE